MPDTNEHYTAYQQYSGLLRTWLVAYGIGAPVVVLTNESLWEKLRLGGDSKTIAILFLLGVTIQVTLAALNKTIMWVSYYADGHPEFKGTIIFKIVKALRRQFWIDFLADIGAMALFAIATFYIFEIITT